MIFLPVSIPKNCVRKELDQSSHVTVARSKSVKTRGTTSSRDLSQFSPVERQGLKLVKRADSSYHQSIITKRDSTLNCKTNNQKANRIGREWGRERELSKGGKR
jgi:hypothetical protein